MFLFMTHTVDDGANKPTKQQPKKRFNNKKTKTTITNSKLRNKTANNVNQRKSQKEKSAQSTVGLVSTSTHLRTGKNE